MINPEDSINMPQPDNGSMLGAYALPVVGDMLIQERQNKKNMELARYQNEFNRQLWYEQMEYNKPINQLARYKEAGINPHMAYMKGTLNNVISSPPKMERAQYQLRRPADTSLNSYMDILAKQASIRNTEANTNYIIKNTEHKGELINKTRIENSISKVQEQFASSNAYQNLKNLEARERQINQQIENAKTQQAKDQAQTELIGLQKEAQQIQLNWLDKQLDQEFQNKNLQMEYQRFVNQIQGVKNQYALNGINFDKDSVATRMTWLLLKEYGYENWNIEAQLFKEAGNTILEQLPMGKIGSSIGSMFGKKFGTKDYSLSQ